MRTYGNCALAMAELLSVNNTNSRAALVLWQVAETGLDPHHLGARFNTCNTTMVQQGATLFNSAGVRNYRSYSDGLNAWYQTINLHYYDQLRSSMRSGTSLELILRNIEASPWGTKHIPRHLTSDLESFAPLSLQGGPS